MQGLDVPGVWAFPKLTVCFNCGSTMLALSEEELHLLQEQAALVRAAWSSMPTTPKPNGVRIESI